MIYTERTVRITNGVANIDAPILLYRGDRQVEILFEIMDSKFKFSSEKGNYIKNVEASFGQLAIDCPDGRDVFTEVAPCIDGAVTFTITGEMIDELYEVGFYSFHIRLFNNDQSSRITIPPIMKGIEIREPIVIEGDDYGKVAMVNYGKVDEAVIENEQATFLDENGNLNIEWKKGDIISSLRLNQMVGYINENAVPGEQGPQGEKGEQGPKGDQGEQGMQGEKGADGLTTSILVNGQTFTHENGVITLPDYPQAGTSADTYSRDEVDDIVYDYSGGKKQRYVTQDEYDNLSEDELNDGTIVWNITDAEEVSIPADLTINDNNLLQLKDANGNSIGTGVTVSTASIPSNELILTSASGYKFKVIVNDEGVLSTEEIITLGNIIASVNELSINEGESATFTIALSEKPSRPQTITITSNNTDVTVNPSSIDISDTNPHTITVAASEDEDYDNDSAILTLSSDNVSNVTINISIKDNDIKPQPCTGISFDKTSLSLKQNNTYKLTATVTPEGCTDEIVWSTSNNNCTVVDGLVTATTIGDCIITATCGNYSATCNVTVNALPASANLFNASCVADGMKYDEETTEISNAARWAQFAYIPIEGGKKYKVSFSANTRILSNTVGSDKTTSYDNICDTNSLVDGDTWFDVTSDVITAHVDASYIRMQLANDVNYKAFIKDICVIEVE